MIGKLSCGLVLISFINVRKDFPDIKSTALEDNPINSGFSLENT